MPHGIDIESSSEGDLGMGELLYRGSKSWQYQKEHAEWERCMSYPANHSDEAMQVYFATHEGEEEDFTKVNGEWRRKDEDYED